MPMLNFSALKSISLIILLGLLCACAPILAVPPAASLDAPSAINTDNALLLMPGDTIKLSVYGEDSLTGNYPVDTKGMITLPMLGEVAAAGLPARKLQENIAQIFKRRGYMDEALVAVDLVTTRPFYILGEVKTPGSYPFQPGLNVFQAIASAGGYTPRAAKNYILIDRKQDDKTIRYNASEITPILPGDSITVRERIF